MQHDQGVVRQLKYRQMFRWLLMLRTFRAAAGPTRVLVAVIGIAMMGAVDYLITGLPFVEEVDEYQEQFEAPPLPFGVMSVALSAGVDRTSILEPWLKIAQPASKLLNRNQTWENWAEIWTLVIGRMLVWTFFGGILVRMFAVQLGRDSSESPRQAARFVAQRYVGYLTGPALPVFGVLFLCIPLFAVGALGQFLGDSGGLLVGISMGLFAVLSLIVVLIVIGVLAGWPLIVATISVEGSDGFDGFSRAYSYVMNRPWQATSLVVLGTIYGLITLTFASVVMDAVFYIGFWAAGIGLGHEAMDTYVGVGLPASFAQCRGLVSQLDGNAEVDSSLIAFYASAGSYLLRGLQYSLFWAVVTVVYLVLRRSDDAVPMDEIFVPQPESNDPVPVVGTAASEQPVTERPIAEVASEPRVVDGAGGSEPNEGATGSSGAAASGESEDEPKTEPESDGNT